MMNNICGIYIMLLGVFMFNKSRLSTMIIKTMCEERYEAGDVRRTQYKGMFDWVVCISVLTMIVGSIVAVLD